MRRRTRARELALQFLYALEARGAEVLVELDDFLVQAGAARPVREFASALVYGVRQHQEEIDKMISEVAQNWDLRRIARIDRNVLRLAMYELLHRSETPDPVILNEAIELAKRYSTQDSGRFVNGVLDRVRTIRDNSA